MTIRVGRLCPFFAVYCITKSKVDGEFLIVRLEWFSAPSNWVLVNNKNFMRQAENMYSHCKNEGRRHMFKIKRFKSNSPGFRCSVLSYYAPHTVLMNIIFLLSAMATFHIVVCVWNLGCLPNFEFECWKACCKQKVAIYFNSWDRV